jgi:HEPN domain-containing protein
MSDARPDKAWFEKADQDLEMARRALGPQKALPAMACYHAQQCAEKYLKGYLVARCIRFRFVHDLIYLTQLCSEHKPADCC